MTFKNLLLVFLLMCCSSAFSQKMFFKHYTGKRYTAQQKDSIGKAGNILTYQDTTQVADSTIVSFYFYDRALTYSSFQKQYFNTPLPKLKLKQLDGKFIDDELFKGKVVMINFWSTTCAPCIAEMPQLNDLVANYGSKVTFIGVAPESVEKVKSLLRHFEFNFIIAADAEKVLRTLALTAIRKFFYRQAGNYQIR